VKHVSAGLHCFRLKYYLYAAPLYLCSR